MWILVVAGLLLLVLFAWGAHQQNEGNAAKANDILSTVPNFRPAITEPTGGDGKSISIDPLGERFAIITPDQPPVAFRFCDLVGAEIERDGRSIIKTNRGSP